MPPRGLSAILLLGGVAVAQEGSKKSPEVHVRLRGVYVAAPQPSRVPPSVEARDRKRLGVVGNDQIVFFLEELGVASRVDEKGVNTIRKPGQKRLR